MCVDLNKAVLAGGCGNMQHVHIHFLYPDKELQFLRRVQTLLIKPSLSVPLCGRRKS